MTDMVEECRIKFKEVLNSINSESKVTDDTFLEKITKYLKDEFSDLTKEPDTIDWIEKIINAFDSPDLPNQQVANFALKILSIVCSNEWDFAAIKERGILDKVRNGIEKHSELQKPSIKFTHIQLLQSISQHSIGLQWLKQTKSWKLCIKYYESSSTLFIIRESGIFLYNIIKKFCELMKDENLCMEIIEEILTPLITKGNRNTETPSIVNDENLPKQVMPCLKVTNNILSLCIESKSRSRMAYYILSKYRYENKIWLVMDLTWGNDEFLRVMKQGLNIGNFARLSCMDIPPSDTKTTDLPFDVHTVHFYNMMMACLVRRCFKDINLLCEMHHQLWYKLGDLAPPEVVLENHDLKYGDQVIMIQTLPIIFVIRSRFKGTDEYINELCTKMFNMSCEHTIRLLYHYRDALANENLEFSAELAANSIQTILSLKKYLNRDRAALAFQILCYVLKGYVDEPCDDNGERICNTQLVLQAPNLLSTLLIALNEMIKHFKFSWSECIESTAIVPLLLVLLDNQNLSSRQTIESLKLIQTSIEHFLAPNLALLMDKLEGSGMENLGPMIYKRLHDMSWEVRDSVLELLHSIVEISNEKFPPFQRHIMESKICEIVEIVARNDGEAYVKASALKVLASMIKIQVLWDHSLYQLDVKKYAMETLGAESEGIVRREAVSCICAVYRYQQVPQHCLDLVFSILAHCAVNDLYWEVKVNALNFWKTVICRQFVHQGMIDGTFPAVTFSKEHKKIITLTDKEIQLRLGKVLNELALRGCLGILLACLKDSDLEVVRKTVVVLEKLMGYLNKYNFIEEYNKSKNKASTSGSKIPVIDSNYADFEMINLSSANGSVVRNNADFSKTKKVCLENKPLTHGHDHHHNHGCKPDDTVIHSIANDQDINLLRDLECKFKLEHSKDCSGVKLGLIDENLYKKFASVTSDKFLHEITQIDLKTLVDDKADWLLHSETFSSLLDDVLRSFGQNVELDCY